MKLSELPNDSMFCVEKSKDFFYQVLNKDELEKWLAMKYQYPYKFHAPLPEIYIAIPTGKVNKDNEEVFECGDAIELEVLNPKLLSK